MTNIERGRRAHLSLVPPLPERVEPPAPAARRRPRSPHAVTYSLRIALEGVAPEVWRRFTVPSDIMLDALHQVLQTVMGWEDKHQHCFISAREKYAADSLRFDTRPRFDAPDHCGMEYEDTARLDEVLAEPGDLLFYQYNFSDGWEHVIVLEEVGGPVDGAGPACLAGARRCPPESAGGAYKYALLLESFEAAAFFAERRRSGGPAPDADAERFRVKDVNTQLRRQTRLRAHYPGPTTLAAGLLRLIPEPAAPQLYSLLDRAELHDEAARGMTAEEAEAATEGLRWLLRRVGSGGLALTPAGYLRPAEVVVARAELGWDGDPTRISKRESDCHELLDLRMAAEFLGLTHTGGARLVRTELGEALGEDPSALLAHIAAALPAGTEELERDAGLLCVLLMASGVREDHWARAMAEALTAMGWRTVGQPVDQRDVFEMAGPTAVVLKGVGAFGTRPVPEGARLAPESGWWGPRWGREFARMMLLRPRS